jgi:hypothetical protein
MVTKNKEAIFSLILLLPWGCPEFWLELERAGLSFIFPLLLVTKVENSNFKYRWLCRTDARVFHLFVDRGRALLHPSGEGAYPV